jgi:hypothetical protein
MIAILILLAAVAMLGVGGFYAWKRARTPQQEPYYFCRCSHCAQKIRYLASRAGREASCPRCQKRCTLPFEAQTRVPDPPSAYRRRFSRTASRPSATRHSRRASA